MCSTCGCGHGQTMINGKAARRQAHADEPAQGARSGYRAVKPLDAVHAPHLNEERVLRIEADILADNDAQAAQIRARLKQLGIFALNLVSSPGSGKTTLLVETIKRWQSRTPMTVIEGDQQTANDAERIRATGAHAVQINTGKGCHLDARMVQQAMQQLESEAVLPANSVLMIENVGNLVCPAAFDLGEAHKVVILSVTEGADKPLKYPDMFRAADLMIISKVDLLPYVDFDVEAAVAMARQIRPGLPVLLLSSKTGEGWEPWLDWLESGVSQARA